MDAHVAGAASKPEESVSSLAAQVVSPVGLVGGGKGAGG